MKDKEQRLSGDVDVYLTSDQVETLLAPEVFRHDLPKDLATHLREANTIVTTSDDDAAKAYIVIQIMK